jgi:phage tail sheath protein FI
VLLEHQTPGVYVEELSSGVRVIQAVPIATTVFIGRATTGSINVPTHIFNYADFKTHFGGASDNNYFARVVSDFFNNGGERAIVVRLGKAKPQAAFKSAFHVLNDTEFHLLCIPPYDDGDVDLRIWHAAAEFCEKRRAFLIIDPPITWLDTATAVQGVVELPASANAAVYYPRFTHGVPCGAIAGIYARTDAAYGVWKAPAGTEATLLGVSGLSQKLNDTDSDQLNQVNVNGLRKLTQFGLVVWGARTLAGNDNEWRYVPVRRLALFVEESIYQGTKWVVFEPNDESLWSTLRQSIAGFLYNLFREGAFPAATTSDAYLVRCDRTTMTQSDIDAGRVIIEVGFAPLKPAEFVIIRFQRQTIAN